MSAYFNPSEMIVPKKEKNAVTLHITYFPEPHEAIAYNIAGWIEKALEISGCKNIRVAIPKSLARKDEYTEFDVSWS